MCITVEGRKRPLLVPFGGFELQDVYESFEDSGNTYTQLKEAFRTYFERIKVLKYSSFRRQYKQKKKWPAVVALMIQMNR